MKRPQEPDLPLREPLSADISALFNSGLHSDLNLKVKKKKKKKKA
jgi:hypothetical protein